jgi:hypothetical protein
VAACWPIAIHLLPSGSLGPRTRAGRLTVASLAAVYVTCFLPPDGWTLVGVEQELGDAGRVDLVWRDPAGELLCDELKLAATLAPPTGGDGPGRRQSARYAAHGSLEHGARFAGVRLILLGAPRHSMLVGPGGRLRRLTDTPYWFERGRQPAPEVRP